MMEKQKDPIRVPLANGQEMVFRHVPAGTFRMGQRGKEAAEEPVTEVFVEEFWMGETPVTRGQYKILAGRCMDELVKDEDFEGPEPDAIENAGDGKRPVVKVSWHEARIVGEWLTEEMRRMGKLPKGYRVDLPWESQWEKACRWGTETEYHSGDGKAGLAEVGWFEEYSKADPYPVKSKPANRGGMSDWHGSVWQWCRDAWVGKASRLRLPGEAEPGERSEEGDRVLRGGSWYSTARICRSACSYRFGPGDRNGGIGFRLALVPGLVKTKRPEAQGGAEPKASPEEAKDEPEQA